jgi:hypothetical protein
MNDRRREARHEIVLPIEIAGTRAETRDVSATGIYFHSATLFDAGADIEFVLPLPTFAESGVEMRCRGKIVRVDATAGGCGVAATIDRFALSPRIPR